MNNPLPTGELRQDVTFNSWGFVRAMQELASMADPDDWSTPTGPDTNMVGRYAGEAYRYAIHHQTAISLDDEHDLVPMRLTPTGCSDLQIAALLGGLNQGGRRRFIDWALLPGPIHQAHSEAPLQQQLRLSSWPTSTSPDQMPGLASAQPPPRSPAHC